MEQTKRLLVQVKSDIEHLANKVHHLKAVRFLIFNFLTHIPNLNFKIDKESRSFDNNIAEIGRVRVGSIERDGGKANQAVRGPRSARHERDQTANERGRLLFRERARC